MDLITFELKNQVGILSINRPEERNALNRAAVDELEERLEKIRKSAEIRALIIGSHGHFAAGADIKEMASLTAEEAGAFSFGKAFRKLEALEIVTIAAVEGYALGGGLELALACDFRVAARNAKLGFPEINLGIMPGAGGTVRAPLVIGASKAKELIFSGEIIDAGYAERIGLVNKVVETGKAIEESLLWAESLCGKPFLALKTAKKSIGFGLTATGMEKALEYEKLLWSELFHSRDQKEGMAAFLEKRKPNFLHE